MIYKEVLHTQHKNVSSFVKVVEKCVNLCLILIHKLKENKRKKNMAIQFEILMQKLLLFLVITTKNDESWNYSLKKYSIYKQSLYEIVNDDTKKIIDSLLFLYEEFILKIEPDKIHDIDIESNVYRYDKIKLFYQKYLVLKKSFDKNFENILDSDLEYG